jgi:hypothetical protein
LCGIIKSIAVNGRYQLIEVSSHLIGYAYVMAVYALEDIDHVLGDVQEWSNQEGAEQEVHQQSPLVEDTHKHWIVALATDLVGKTDVEAADQQVAEYEGEDGSHSHTHCQKGTVAAPPQIDDDDCIVE